MVGLFEGIMSLDDDGTDGNTNNLLNITINSSESCHLNVTTTIGAWSLNQRQIRF